MSASFHNRAPMPASKANLSQILNPSGHPQPLRTPDYPVQDQHVHQYQQYDFGYPSQQGQWNSRRNGEELGNRYPDNRYYTNGMGEQHTEYATERTAISGDRDYSTNHHHQQHGAGNALLPLNHNQSRVPMFSGPDQHSHSHLQPTERASTRIQARNTAEPSSSFYTPDYEQRPAEPSRKRNTPPEIINPPQPKKAKKAPSAPSAPSVTPSKRGFSKKKRDEAAAAHAQNAIVPTVTYVNSDIDKEPASDNRMRMLQVDESSDRLAQLHAELQSARCMSTKYKHDMFPRCNSCIRRWAGDVCRFQGLRIFMKNEKKQIVGMSFVNNQRADKGTMVFPNEWNVPQTDENILWTMRVTARYLLPILEGERKHVSTQQIIYRHREIDCRATCDTCMTSLFCCTWMCRLCGREACGDCYAELQALTSDPIADLRNSSSSSSPEVQAEMAARIAAQQARKEKQSNSNPTFLYCTKRSEHRAEEFTPVSRFCLRELEEAIMGMRAILKEGEPEQVSGEPRENVELNSSGSSASESTGVRTPPDLGVSTSSEKDTGYPHGYRYPELQEPCQQPYRSYSHQVSQQQQRQPYVSQLVTHAPHLTSAPSTAYHQSQQQMQYPQQEQYSSKSLLPRPHQYSYDPHFHASPHSQSSSSAQPQQFALHSQLHPDSDAQANTVASAQLSASTAPSLYQPPSHSSDIPLHAIPTYTFGALTQPIFQGLWNEGTPILVTDLAQRFRIQWTPEYFIKTYGTQSCLIVECQTDENKQVTVGEFFAEFGKYANRGLSSTSVPASSADAGTSNGADGSERSATFVCKTGEIWKLKDWPPSADFKTTFPELYEDFSQTVPIPNYVRRDGTLNIASHFPRNGLAPDLGPKMYNAMASSLGPGSKGSTRLHMDMADALNIMTYAADSPDGSPGCAAWDLFRAEDSVKIRDFLKAKFPGSIPTDPIHGQQVYMDEVMRKELAEKCGVFSYRVYQRPGEAVFIPAGCAHQVCNLADCIKVAIDFVSPENIERCQQLTKEFREQNQSKAWKEDVLGLKNMMWFAWLSCCKWQEERKKGDSERRPSPTHDSSVLEVEC